MRRSASMDRMSLGPLRVRQEENKPSTSGTKRKSSMSSMSNRQSTGGRSMSGNRMSMGSRQSTSEGQKSQISRFGAGQKNRLSRGSGIGVRSNGIAKDPRPLSDKGYQHKCIKNVLQFLTERGYPHNISIKVLQTPTSKDVFKIFEFIYSFKDPKFKISAKPEEEIPRLLKMVGYPFMISRTSMYAIGSPHTWPSILAALTFLIEWVTYGLDMFEHVDHLTFPNDDDAFDSVPESLIMYKYYVDIYQKFMDGEDEYDEADNKLRLELRQKFLGSGGGIDGLLEENAALEQQLQLLDQDTDRLKGGTQKLEVLQHDEERFIGYLSELETHKRQQEQQLVLAEEQCTAQEIELEAENSKVLKMQGVFDGQEFTPEDVERINVKRRELNRQREDVERSIQAVEEDVWKEEVAMSKEMEKVESKCQTYNKLAHSLKLIPVSADNSSGVQYEMKKPSFSDGTVAEFATSIKPALLTLKSQCAESSMRKESEKISVMEKLEQAAECQTDVENELSLLDSKYRRAEDEVDAKKQMYQKEFKRIQQIVEELENEMVQLNNTVFLSQHDVGSQRKQISAWAILEKEKCQKSLIKHNNFFQEGLDGFMNHIEVIQTSLTNAKDMSEKQRETVTKEAASRGIVLEK